MRLKAPLSGSKQTVARTGTVTIDKLWDGAGLYEQIETESPEERHWRGLTFFLYNPASGQWSQRFAGSSGRFGPAIYGGFKNGRGELYGQEELNGRAVLVRGIWSDIKPNSHTFEEAYSDDGGKTWETVITAHLTRTAPGAQPAFPPSVDGSHDFDFDHGPWRTRSSRLRKPLSGSTEWVELTGATRVLPLWGGRANLAVFETDGPTGHLELISLRLFDPKARQWSLNFATRGDGVWSLPTVGEFRNGRGTFYDQEDFGGRMILVRFTFTAISPTEARSEQAFSADGGKTWETNWINRYTRAESGATGL